MRGTQRVFSTFGADDRTKDKGSRMWGGRFFFHISLYIPRNFLFIGSGKSEMCKEKWRGKNDKIVRTDTLYSPGTKAKQAVFFGQWIWKCYCEYSILKWKLNSSLSWELAENSSTTCTCLKAGSRELNKHWYRALMWLTFSQYVVIWWYAEF